MTLIKSISGIRGTIGGPCGESLTPVDIVKFTYAYCERLRRHASPRQGRFKVVVGRDARISGAMVEQLVCGTLNHHRQPQPPRVERAEAAEFRR